MSERLFVQHLHDRRNGRSTPAPLPVSTSFLAPDADVGRLPGEIWKPHTPSIASRMPPARSKGFCRGSLVDPTTNRVIVYESTLERDFACILLADRRVVHLHDQPPAVVYVMPGGQRKRHTFDFLATTMAGHRLAIAIKPTAMVERSGILETLELIRQQAPTGFADQFLLRTERQITRRRATNARWILRARRARNEADVEDLRRFTSSLDGAVNLTDLVAASSMGARGWNAAVCLIDEGCLELVGQAVIGDQALVRHPARASR